ncbi:MAG: hypothetical protein RL328_2695, partial [Acidobacteriota bacterium]
MGRLLVWLVLAGLQAAWAADYRLIQATSLFSFVAQANELATEGYRLTVWDSRVTYCGIFERLVEDDPARYEYAGVPTTQRFQKKIRESLNRLGSDGFRVIPQGFGLATAVLMERRTGETQHFDYEYGRAQMEDLWVGPFFGRKPAKFDGQGYGLVSLVRPPLT